MPTWSLASLGKSALMRPLRSCGLDVNACAFLLDVTDAEQFAQFADSAFTAFGDVALVVNNVAVQQRGSVVDTAETEMQRGMAVNQAARLSAIREAVDEQGTLPPSITPGRRTAFIASAAPLPTWRASTPYGG